VKVATKGKKRRTIGSIARTKKKNHEQLQCDRRKQKITNRIHGIYRLPTLIAFPLYPMPIEVREKSVDVVGTRGVSLPFRGVVPEECLVFKGFYGLLNE